jgi:hypothetical protein
MHHIDCNVILSSSFPFLISFLVVAQVEDEHHGGDGESESIKELRAQLQKVKKVISRILKLWIAD